MSVGSEESVNSLRSDDESRECIRRLYEPENVHMLFVGEAPPASGLFFYDANSGLYRAVRETFLHALPGLRETDFLNCFQRLGCYLVDLCGKPIDRLDKDLRKRICSDSEPELAETIRTLKPKFIVSVVRSIQDNVTRACERADFGGQHMNLPYPGRWVRHCTEFKNALAPLLKREFDYLESR